ncbi:MAG: hypothetical protein AAGK32_15005 [Actinomycetota bacterium]
MQLQLKRKRAASPTPEASAVFFDEGERSGWSESDLVLESLHRSVAVVEYTPQGEILDANDNFLADRLSPRRSASQKSAYSADSASAGGTKIRWW